MGSQRSAAGSIALALAGWTAVAAVVAVILHALRPDLPLPTALVSAGVWYYLLGALVWIACALDESLSIWAHAPRRAWLERTGIGLAALLLWSIAVIVIARGAIGPDFWNAVFSPWWMFQLLSTAAMYAAGVGVGLSAQGLRRDRERRQREARLELLAREAELAAIRAQLHPHFLFNALNSVLALIEEDPAEAREMLTRLSSLLHAVFSRVDVPLVPLDRELDIVRDYLEIEKIRFGDRLTFAIDNGDGCGRAPVPPLLLQPIVENAVKHGIEPHDGPGSIRIASELVGARLRLVVTNSGQRIARRPQWSDGVGLSLTRRRLDATYGGGAATLSAEGGTEGFTVVIDMPASVDAA